MNRNQKIAEITSELLDLENIEGVDAGERNWSFDDVQELVNEYRMPRDLAAAHIANCIVDDVIKHDKHLELVAIVQNAIRRHSYAT